LLAAETFLLDNGHEPAADDASTYAAALALATGDMSEGAFAAWLRDNIVAV